MVPLETIIKINNEEDLVSLELCAKDYLELLDNFYYNYAEGNYFILCAYHDENLVGLLIADKKAQKLDSLEKILPIVFLKLIYVVPKYRKQNIGRKLLTTFINIEKSKKTASIIITLPVNYIDGIKFFQKFGFHKKKKIKNSIFLIKNLWDDYGIRDIDLLGSSFF